MTVSGWWQFWLQLPRHWFTEAGGVEVREAKSPRADTSVIYWHWRLMSLMEHISRNSGRG